MRWIWDPAKNARNRQRHGLSFEVARQVFNDPLAASRRDPYPEEERWQTIGMIESVIVMVIHTYPRPDKKSGEEVGRIISARKATKHERRAYEEADF